MRRTPEQRPHRRRRRRSRRCRRRRRRVEGSSGDPHQSVLRLLHLLHRLLLLLLLLLLLILLTRSTPPSASPMPMPPPPPPPVVIFASSLFRPTPNRRVSVDDRPTSMTRRYRGTRRLSDVVSSGAPPARRFCARSSYFARSVRFLAPRNGTGAVYASAHSHSISRPAKSSEAG